jgi:lipopolysaccharide export system protein LptA
MRRVDPGRSGGWIRRAWGWGGAARTLLAVLTITPASAQTTVKSLAVLPGAAAAAATPKTAKPILPGASGKEPINIDAGRLEYFDKEQKAIYTGGVVAVQGESRLKTEVLTIFLDRMSNPGAEGAPAGTGPGTASQVRRMEATGGVTITQKDQVGTGDRGTYDKGENKVYLFGNVTLSQGPNVTKGDKLTYDLTSGQAVVEGGRVKSLFVPGSQPEATNVNKKNKTSPARRRRIGAGRKRGPRRDET